MPGTRQTNTFGEVLQKSLRDLADAMVLPDADQEFIKSLQDILVAKIRQPIDTMNATGASQVPGNPALAAAQMPTPMAPDAGGGGVPGLRSMAPQGPAVDELRRMLITS